VVSMASRTVVSLVFTLLSLAAAQEGASDQEFDLERAGANFRCPEDNGLFPDPEQCDLYYECTDGEAVAQYCPDGLLFDYSRTNRESCKLPSELAAQGADCGDRIYVQEADPNIVDKDYCPHANGFFNHPDPTVCDKFSRCDNGVRYELACAPPLMFDQKTGGCSYENDLSAEAKQCSEINDDGTRVLKSIDGFTCPGGDQIGPNDIPTEHNIHGHPTDCQYFFVCYYGTDPNKFGCEGPSAKNKYIGQVFDSTVNQCKDPEEVPECSCWYDCKAASCEDCNSDCSCGSG